MKKISGFVLIAVIFSLLGCTSPAAPGGIPAEVSTICTGITITLGDVSDDPSNIIPSMQPFMDHLSGKLAPVGYDCGSVRVPDSLDKLIELIKNGEVDIYMDSVYPATLVTLETGAQPILRRWRYCVPDYYSIIFTKTGSGINSLEDLPGHVIAMDWAYSTTGFAMPAAYLIDRGYRLVIVESYTDSVSSDQIGIYFSFDDKNALNLVLEGKVSAAATDDYYFGKWEQELREAANATAASGQASSGLLVKLAETEPVPRQVVLVRAGLSEDVKNAIQTELKGAELDPEWTPVLENASQTCKFDEPPEGLDALFDQMQATHFKIKDIPGLLEAIERGSG